MFGVGAHRPNEARAPVFLQRKDGKKVARVEGRRGVRRSSRCRARRRPRRRTDVRRCRREIQLPAPRAPRNARRRNPRCRPPRTFRWRHPLRCRSRVHPARRLLERHELGSALHLDAGVAQAIDQQPFVLVLRKDQRVGKRTDAGAHVAEDRARATFAGRPEIDGDTFASARRRPRPRCRSGGTARACVPAQQARATSFPAPPSCP